MFRCNVERPSLHVFLVSILCLCFFLRPTAQGLPLQGKQISISVQKSTLANILNQISKKSGITIYFSDSDLSAYTNINYTAKDQEVTAILADLFKGKDLRYEVISEKQIGVRKTRSKILSTGELHDTLLTVSGTVMNEKGEPLPGATVKVKNKNNGVTADVNGYFVIKDIPSTSVLTISNIAYQPVEVPISGKSSLGRVALKELIGIIDEAVVIAYGTTTRRLNTGNVTTIKAEEIQRQPLNNPLLALQGRVAGLEITPTTGLAGGSINIQIRGRNTLNNLNSADPLVVIDGLPVANTIEGLGFSPNLQRMSALSFVNPNDIESIEVLKDGDATSIYGSRGANGVILITTKKGRAGEVKVDINAQFGWATVPKRVDLLNTEDYLELRKEAYANSGVNLATASTNASRADVKLWDQTRYTDWQDELIGGTAKYNDLQTSISGGTTNVKYIIGGNFHRETTVFPGDNDDKRGSGHLSLSGQSANQKFNALARITYMSDHNTLPGIDLTQRATTLAPNAPDPYNPDGTLNWEPLPSGAKSWDNPYVELFRTYDATINNLIASSDISYKILPYLSLKTQVSYNDLKGNSFRKTFPFAGRSPQQMNSAANSTFNTNSSKNISIEPQINLSMPLFGGSVQALLGGSYQSTSLAYQSITAEGFTSDALLGNLQAATNYFIQNSSSQYKYSAIFGRLNYNWKNKYIFNINGRRDGSSRFGPGKRFGNFGSVAAAWIFTEENFIKNSISFLSFGKLRFSYGSSGNDGISDYGYFERYEPILGPETYQDTRGYRTTGLYNRYYAWEVTKKLEIGLEAGIVKDRVLFNLSYYSNKSDNQLLNFPFPSIAGPGNPLYNLPALIKNSGLELAILSENIKASHLKWSTSINVTRNRNKLLAYPNLANSPYYSIFEVGQPFAGIQLLYKSSGVDPETGQYQFTTIKGTNTLNPEDPQRPDGGKFIRLMTAPKFYGGLSNSLSFKNISLDFLIQFCKQTGISPIASYLSVAGAQYNLPAEFNSRWRKQGDMASIQKVYSSTPSNYFQAANYRTNSDVTYVDASFARLKNVSLSYNIPESIKRKMRMQNARVYIQGQNIVTITGYKGFDPETQSLGALPPLRVYVVGIQVGL